MAAILDVVRFQKWRHGGHICFLAPMITISLFMFSLKLVLKWRLYFSGLIWVLSYCTRNQLFFLRKLCLVFQINLFHFDLPLKYMKLGANKYSRFFKIKTLNLYSCNKMCTHLCFMLYVKKLIYFSLLIIMDTYIPCLILSFFNKPYTMESRMAEYLLIYQIYHTILSLIYSTKTLLLKYVNSSHYLKSFTLNEDHGYLYFIIGLF